MGMEPRTPKRQSFAGALLSQKKRLSRNTPVLRPDPFRYGDPNPLDCHPYFSDKHPDYIVRPHTVHRPVSFPVFSPTPAPTRWSVGEQDNLKVSRSQGFVPKLLRIDSIVAILDFFDLTTVTRAIAGSIQPEKKPPEILHLQQKSPSPTFGSYHSDVSLQDFAKCHEAARGVGNENESFHSSGFALITPPPTPPKGIFSPASHRRPAPGYEPSIKHSSTSGLPKGWKVTHDRFIAYLDTHAPLTSGGEVPIREFKKPRYTVEQMVSLLKGKFVRFRSVPIPAWAIERRLEILDYRDNDYFDMPYWHYSHEVWARGI